MAWTTATTCPFPTMLVKPGTPAQEVELYRIVPPAQAIPMKKAGKYSHYRLGVSPTGVWQYFLQ